MADIDVPEVDLAKATRLVRLAVIVLVVACLVLAIDYRLKNYIIKEGQKTLLLLDKARGFAEEAQHGQARADDQRAADSAAVGAADGVGDDASAGADVGSVANGRGVAPVRRSSGTAGRPGGHGGRAGGAA